MGTIRVARGADTGPTATSSFDGALADANVHNYNLVTLSSVIPTEATVEMVGTAPDLGPSGEALHCVLGRETVAPGADGEAVAGLGWVRSVSGRGLFYETSGTDGAAVRRSIEAGLERGMELRDWAFGDDPDAEVVVESTPAAAEEYATAVVVAAYGESESLFE